MQFKQFYLTCLAQASYLLGDDGQCAIVDPRRDVDEYIETADALGLKIRHIIETHLHADFVSGHLELAERTGATIHLSHKAGATFNHHAVHDGDEIVMGTVVLRFLETPGHTPESLCITVTDTSVSEQPQKILTGDTLFIGDVGRPDLASSKGYTAEDMAGLMYDTLRNTMMTLPDEVEVFPGHGAGSACGKNISSALSSTIAEQKAFNYALQPMTKEAFVGLAVSNLAPSPKYFSHDAEINRAGAPSLASLAGPVAYRVEELQSRVADGAIVLDVRDAASYGEGHVPGSINVGLGGTFACWCGSLLPLDAPLILVVENQADVEEAVMRLARVGLHTVAGYLDGGFPSWQAADLPVARVPQRTVDELAELLADAEGAPFVLDVRAVGEHADGHVPGATNIPLPQLAERAGELDPARPTTVICLGGYRSSAACSLLERVGFDKLENVTGGTRAWIDAGHATESEEPAIS
jgi:glyoxylase-like metal-dependent hydrolase (beta-lactamase superfamily II)/rhodanese-related sulfurtransferase